MLALRKLSAGQTWRKLKFWKYALVQRVNVWFAFIDTSRNYCKYALNDVEIPKWLRKISTIEKQSLEIIIWNHASAVLVIPGWTCELCKELAVPPARTRSSVCVRVTDDWSTPSRHANELFVDARMLSGDNRWRLAPAYDDGRHPRIQ